MNIFSRFEISEKYFEIMFQTKKIMCISIYITEISNYGGNLPFSAPHDQIKFDKQSHGYYLVWWSWNRSLILKDSLLVHKLTKKANFHIVKESYNFFADVEGYIRQYPVRLYNNVIHTGGMIDVYEPFLALCNLMLDLWL